FPPQGGLVRLLDRGRLRAFDTRGRSAGAIRVGRGLGGGVVLTRDGHRVLVGAGRGSDRSVVVNLRRRRIVRRVRSGPGPARVTVSEDGTRAYVTARGGVKVLSTITLAGLATIRL